MVQRILAADFEHYEKGQLFRSYMKSLLGSGIFNADGERSHPPKRSHRVTLINTLLGELWKYALLFLPFPWPWE